MFITTENEQISLSSSVIVLKEQHFKSSLMNSNPDSPDGLPLISEMSDSPPLPTIFTDVNVIPEHDKNGLLQSMSNLEGEIAELRMKNKLWNEKRREALNKILDIKGIIRVFCRVRPFLEMDRRRIRKTISTGSEKILVMSGGTRKEFEFDKVFDQEVSQGDIFVEVEPILRSALDGHNVCVLAYGQTGTGKTFTMDGTNEQPGIIPRALKELFRQASTVGESLTFSMSMLEVYMGSLRDLLAPRPSYRAYEPVARCNLNIQTDPKGNVEIEGLTEVQVLDNAKARWWYNRGRRARSTSWTNVNESSSRSHCLTRVTIFRHGNGTEAKTEVSKLWMVDLGGSERLLKTGASGLTLDEGRAINLSLSALGDVIAALRRKRGHVPYRNSKLTQILKDSLGDGSKVLMLVHVSPCEEDVGETICSLCFAKRARAVESNREQMEDLRKQKEKRVRELEEYMREAEEESRKVKDQIQEAEILLTENKKLYSNTDQPLEYEENAHESPKQDLNEVTETRQLSDQKTSRRVISRSLPRFMTSTVASRERQSASERDIVGRTRSLRSTTRSSIQFTASSSIQFTASQSISFSDRRFKASLQNSIRKKHIETDNVVVVNTESPKCNALDTKSTSLTRSKMVTSSDSNWRAKLCHHRRRMSAETSRYINDHLFQHLKRFTTEQQSMSTDVIRKAFQATEEGFLSLVTRQWSTKPQIAAVGSCCLVGVISGGTLYIANLGDSRAVLGRAVRATGEVLSMQLSSEHNASIESVRQELQSLHPDDSQIVVLKHNVWRVKGLIQISRSIGDVYLKKPEYNREPLYAKFRLREPFKRPILSSEPSISVHQLLPTDQFIIFASDGLWEHLSNQEAVNIVQNHPRSGSAKRLVKAALQEAAKKREMRYSDLKKIDRGVRRHFHDDITVIVVFLDSNHVSRASSAAKFPNISVRGGGIHLPPNTLAPCGTPTEAGNT